ncbi:MAG: TIR domain-containing protein [Candidatus Sumerlaeota bacterium]|nr:TIR domain-containing protein [Candidatus Sumerlaeota bacterium]
MPLRNQSAEIHRLLSAFEAEAAKFHGIRLSTFFVTQSGPSPNRRLISPNHAVMLWQYYGSIRADHETQRFLNNFQESDLQWGLRGAELSSFAVIEGTACDLFVRMALRAGSLFDEEEARTITSRVVDEILQRELAEHPSSKPLAVTNGNPLAIWLNYLLYHLSMTNPGRERSYNIEPDPFSLSLLALERLATDLAIGKIDRSASLLREIRFKVAMSFAGEQRAYVAKVVDALRPTLGVDAIFYDHDYQAQLARPNLDTLLQDIYRNQSELIVVFLCAEYAEKQWCGLEWRAVRDIIKSKDNDRVMFVRFDDMPVDGVFSIDGYIDARTFGAQDVASFITQRLARFSDRR